MATIQEAIKRLRYVFTSEGADKVVSDQNKVTSAIVGSTTQQEKATLSLEKSFSSLERRYNTQVRAQQDFEKVQRQVNAAVAANPALQQRANDVLRLAAEAHNQAGKAANDNFAAFDRLGNMLTRRLIYGVIVAQAKDAVAAIFNLNAELAKTADIAQRIGTGGKLFQGLSFVAEVKGVQNFPDAMIAFNREVDRAKAGVGDLATLFRANGLTVRDTADAFFKVADLVKNTVEEARKFSILEQAGLPGTREMVRVMEMGADRIRKLSDESRKLSDQQLQQAKELDDKWNELWANFKREAKGAVVDFTSWIDKLDDRWQRFHSDRIMPTFREIQGINGIVKVVPVTRGPDLSDLSTPTNIPQITVRPTMDPARMKELLGLEQQRLGILGQMATIEQQVRSVEIGIQLARLNNVKVTKDEEAALLALARAQALGTAQIRTQADSLRIESATVGMTIGDAVAYRLVWERVYEAKRSGRPLNEEQIRQLQEEAAIVGKLVSHTAGLRSFEQAASSAFTGLVSGIASGAMGLDELIAKTAQLGKSLTDIGSKSLFDSLKSGLMGNGFSFDPVSLGIGAAGVALSLASSYFAGQKKAEEELQKAKLAWAGMSDEVRNFNAAADGFELSQFVSAMQQITKTGMDLIKAAMAAGDTAAAVQLIFSGVKQINNQVDQFIKPTGNTVADQIAAVNNEAQQIIGELSDLNAKYGLGLNRTTEILAAAADHIAEIQRKAQEAIDTRRLSFQDRVFAAANDNATLEGQLAAQARDFARERLEEQKAGNEAITDLLLAQQAEELALRKSFADKAIEETKRAQDALNGIARSVVEFLADYTAGPSSTSSPTATLASAQALFNANLPLAQAGNADAQAKFIDLARNLDAAARAVYASGQGYQDIKSLIMSSGLSIPAVQATTDPTTQAMRDVLAELQQGKLSAIASGVGTTASNTATTATSTNSIAADTSFQNQILNFQSLQNGVLEGLNITTSTSATRIVNAINGLGNISAQYFRESLSELAWIRVASIAQVAQGAAPKPGTTAFSWLGFAGGGIAQPGMPIIYGEHHPQGPFSGIVGSQPVAITPNMPGFSNDNSGVISELRAVKAELAALRKENARLMEGQARAGREDAGEIVGAVHSAGDKTERAGRMAALAKRVA
jgi:hypothetical protein